MKIENIFCDICGKEGALTQRKDARHTILNSKEAQNKVKIAKSEDAVYITIGFAKTVGSGGIEDLDLCKNCKWEIENATGEAILSLFRKSRIRSRSSKSD